MPEAPTREAARISALQASLDAQSAGGSPPVLQLRGISKRFGRLVANDDHLAHAAGRRGAGAAG